MEKTFAQLPIGKFFTYNGKTYKKIDPLMKNCCTESLNARQMWDEKLILLGKEIIIQEINNE